jgi:hypothetical protein
MTRRLSVLVAGIAAALALAAGIAVRHGRVEGLTGTGPRAQTTALGVKLDR